MHILLRYDFEQHQGIKVTLLLLHCRKGERRKREKRGKRKKREEDNNEELFVPLEYLSALCSERLHRKCYISVNRDH